MDPRRISRMSLISGSRLWILVGTVGLWLGSQELMASSGRAPHKRLGESDAVSFLRPQGASHTGELDAARSPAEGIQQQLDNLELPENIATREPDLSDVSPGVYRAPPSGDEAPIPYNENDPSELPSKSSEDGEAHSPSH